MPLYSTPEDEARSDAAIKIFRPYVLDQNGNPATPVFKGRVALIDYYFYPFLRVEVCAIVEVRGRSGPSTQYHTWSIDDQKVQAGFDFSAANKVPFGLLFIWHVQTFYAWIDPPNVVERLPGGREDRGDPFDQDLMAHFNPAIFTYIGDIPEALAVRPK